MIRFEFLLTPIAYSQYVVNSRVWGEVLIFGVRVFYWAKVNF